MRVVRRWLAASVRGPRTLACGKGSVFSRQGFLQDEVVQGELGDRLSQALVLAPAFLQPLGLIDLQAPVLSPPLVIGLLRDPGAPTDLACGLTLRDPHLGFTQEPDDL